MKKKSAHKKEEILTGRKEFSWKRRDSHEWLQVKIIVRK